MTTYKFTVDWRTGEPTGVCKDSFLGIPFDPDNTDYQAYLKWVAEGNTPEPAEGA